MTRDEILKMEAGRELDDLVADSFEKKPPYIPDWNTVFMSVSGSGHPVHSEDGFWIASMNYEHGDVVEWIPKPFSTDISAAWEVLEHLSKESEEVFVGHTSDGWDCSVYWYKNVKSGHAVEGIYADAAPLAICRAALLVVMESDHETQDE